MLPLRRRVDQTVLQDIPAARGALHQIPGDCNIIRNENGELFGEFAASNCQPNMVAGAGFEPATFGL